MLAVTFCEFGWLNVSVELCVFCSSVFFCEKENAPTRWGTAYETRWGVFFLTELTDLTEPFGALFRSHRRPPAYRIHRTLQLKKGVGWWLLGVDDYLKMAVRFREIGWLNVSVKLCVFCSSVFFCEKENAPTRWGTAYETRWGVFFSQNSQI